MKQNGRTLIRIAFHLVLLAIFVAPSLAQSASTPPSGQSTDSSHAAPADDSSKKGQKTSSSKSSSKSTASAKVTDSQIAAAKASGQVWVNTDTGVYHKGGRWYGKTKQGKFMDESDAKKAGYKAAEKE
jgi:hypothetical protein